MLRLAGRARALFAASLVTAAPLAAQEPAETVPVLDAITVTDEAEVKGYAAKRSAAATKTDTPLMETPAAVSVITEAQLRDRGVQTLQEALRYSAGVLPDAYGLDNRGDWAIIRGSEFQTLVDGMREEFTFYSVARPDPYALERVEILRGPASVLYGQGPVAGVVNVVSKLPQSEARQEVVADFGSFQRKQVASDLTGPLNADGSLLYRLVGVYRESESQVDFAFFDRKLLAPSITWRAAPDLTWTLLAHYQKDSSANAISFLPHSGTVLPNPNGRIPIERFTSEPDYDRYEVERQALTSFVDWQLTPEWKLHQRIRLADNDNPYRTLYPDVFSNPSDPFIDAQDRVVERSAFTRLSEARALTADQNLQARFTVGAITHDVLVGLDLARARNRERMGFLAAAGPLDLYDPQYGSFTAPTVGPASTTRSQFHGLYVQDQLRIGERWIGVLGLRHDRSKVEPDGGATARDDATTGRAGLMYQATGGIAPYLSFSQSYQPNTATDAMGNVFEPRKGEQLELGLKYQPPGSASLMTATLYDLQERNFVVFDPGTGQNILSQVDAKGLELEAAGRIGSIDFTAAYAYTDAETREFYAVQPEHLASLWGKYRWQGFEFGAGVRHLGSSTSESGRLEIDSATLLDAMLAYDWQRWRFSLHGSNLADEEYLTSCLDRGDCFYGLRRTVVGNVSYRW
ncbi:MAG TPA: TonB-dependent siderophore receptor [Nevskiales bacterium]|nr:TonB-dependent siderophore receptor [Nevskiales bacterium]